MIMFAIIPDYTNNPKSTAKYLTNHGYLSIAEGIDNIHQNGQPKVISELLMYDYSMGFWILKCEILVIKY